MSKKAEKAINTLNVVRDKLNSSGLFESAVTDESLVPCLDNLLRAYSEAQTRAATARKLAHALIESA